MRALRAPAVILLFVVAGAVCASAFASVPVGVRTVVITIRHSRFSVSSLEVKRGQEVRFVVHNTDPIDHELIVGPMEVQNRHEDGRERWHPPVPGEVTVPLYKAASTSYRFDKRGTVWFGCHLPGHWDYGMRGRINVK